MQVFGSGAVLRKGEGSVTRGAVLVAGAVAWPLQPSGRSSPVSHCRNCSSDGGFLAAVKSEGPMWDRAFDGRAVARGRVSDGRERGRAAGGCSEGGVADKRGERELQAAAREARPCLGEEYSGGTGQCQQPRNQFNKGHGDFDFDCID